MTSFYCALQDILSCTVSICFYNILECFGHVDVEDLGSDGTTEPVHKRLRLSHEDGEDPQDSTSTEYSVVTLPSE